MQAWRRPQAAGIRRAGGSPKAAGRGGARRDEPLSLRWVGLLGLRCFADCSLLTMVRSRAEGDA